MSDHSRSDTAEAKAVYYASIGPELTAFDIDLERGALVRRGTVALPANVQYAWPHPSRRYLYVVSSNGGPGVAGDRHYASALLIDAASGALRLHGRPVSLPSRPIHAAVDGSGAYLLTAYNNPSNVTVHKIDSDGTIAASVAQPENLDIGIYAHQVRTEPSNRIVLLVTRGNNPTPSKPEDPGAIKTFRFDAGVLTNLASIAPGNGQGFGPRHLDIHPHKPWVFVSVERQNKLYVYGLDGERGLESEPMFIKETLAWGSHVGQGAGPIHIHPNGKFVYMTNRTAALTDYNGQKILAGGENSVAVFAIDQITGEPTRIQNIDGQGIHLRTFGIDPSGSLLVAASIKPLPVREGDSIGMLTAGISVFRIGSDGKLEFVRKYDVDTSNGEQFWSGMVMQPLPNARSEARDL